MRIAPLDRSHLSEAELVLADACAFDRATEVAEEKLFGPAPLIASSAQQAREAPSAPGSPARSDASTTGDPGATTAAGTARATRSAGAPRGESVAGTRGATSSAAAPGATTAAGTAGATSSAGAPGDALPLGTPPAWAAWNPAVRLCTPAALGAWDGDVLVGVAAVAERWLRVIAVAPRSRRRGIGSALLAECEAAARAAGAPRVRALDQPGNYLAPGVDERNVEAIAWLERRGYVRSAEPRLNVLIDVRGNPRVSAERAAASAAAATARGYEIRRARPEEHELLAAVAAEFGGAWPFELATALAYDPPAVHIAVAGGAYCAFAAHDGTNRGLGWFGPTGTWPAHRGQGLGEALLLACLVDVAREHSQCEVAWIGPRPFYEKVAGIASERRFVGLAKELAH